MKRIPTLLASILLLPVLLRAQEVPAAADPITEAWHAFQDRHGADWSAVWNKATGTPKAIFGPGLALGGPIEELEVARAQAAGVLREHADLLGRGASDFVESIGVKANQVWVFVYDQQFKGLPVISGRADVRIHETGGVSMFGSKAVRIPADFALTPALNAVSARAIAEDYLFGQAATNRDVPAPRLVVWADAEGAAPTAPVLAWEVRVDERPARVVVGRVFVDALRASVLQHVDEVIQCGSCAVEHVRGDHRHTERMARSLRLAERARPAPRASAVALTGQVLAWTNRTMVPTGAMTNVPLPNVLVTSSAGNAYTDVNGNFSIPYTGTAAVTVDATLTGRHSKRIRVAQGVAMTASAPITPGTPGTIQFGTAAMVLFDRAQTTTYWHVDDVNQWLRSLLPTASQMNSLSGMNPQVNIASSCNAYYTGLTINHYHESSTCNMTAYASVIYHEWGHGLDDVFGGISQTDGLSEGWGDIVSTYREGNPIVGQQFTKTGGYIRTALNTRTYPVGGTSPHAQGETWMGFAWDLRNNLITALGSAAGSARAQQIVVASVAADATNQPDAVREVFVLDDDDANLNNGTPNYASLEAAALKRTLPYPKRQFGSITHFPLQSTTEQLLQRVVQAFALPLSGTFTKVELVYTIGTTTSRVGMVPGSRANEYLALLPGLLSPASVSYHIEASHSSNTVVRSPDTGEITYSIGQESRIFFDDFEGASQAWTHASQTTVADDWQFGRPAGKSGTSNGVAWADPPAAASSNAWGTDLGNTIGTQTWNGAYAANSNSYLRSPAINTSGQTGVTLKFKRWLTVEESQYDQATISVNGQQVWINPSVGHILDKAWTDFALQIPAADNKPSVFLEWRLQADAGMHLGGWNVDDVQVFTFQSLPAPKLQFTLSQAQIDLGKSAVASISGTANAPLLVLISLTPGPVQIPGLPTLYVGGNFIPVGAALDGNGQVQFPVPIPAAGPTGTLVYGQALELTNPTTVTGSNGVIVLFGK